VNLEGDTEENPDITLDEVREYGKEEQEAWREGRGRTPDKGGDWLRCCLVCPAPTADVS
jgi:hypothetical protein